MGERGDLPYGEVRDDESTKSKCREPNVANSLPGRAESSSDSGSFPRAHGRVTYTAKNVLLGLSRPQALRHGRKS